MSNPLIHWIETQTIPQSLLRGRNYRDNIKRLKEITTGHWEAKAFGSEVYDVEIFHHGGSEFEGTCDCLYDKGGLCKHIVAMAYEIAENNDFSSANTTKQVLLTPEKATNKIADNDYYDDFFSKQNEEIKNNFLRQLFSKDETLRNQFLLFVAQELVGKNTQSSIMPTMPQSSKIDISELVAEIAGELNDLSLDYDDYYEDNSSNRGGSRGYIRYDDYYDDYGEGGEEWATEQVEKALKSYKTKLANFLKINDLRSAIDVYIALYLASLECEDQSSEIFDDSLENVIFNVIENEKLSIVAFIEKAILSDTSLRALIDYLLNFWQGSKAELHLDVVEPFLIALNEKSNIAKPTLDFIKAKKMIFSATSSLCFHLAEKVGDADFWFSVAEKFYEEDSEVAVRYLNRLKSDKSIKKFHTILKVVWTQHHTIQKSLAKSYKNDLIFSENSKIYLAIWEYVASTEMNLEVYQNLENYWSPSEKNGFIEAQKAKNTTFYAQLLKHEKRHEQLLEFVQNYKDSYWNSKYPLLDYIGDIYPEEAFTLFKQMIIKDEEQMKMDRNGYASLCGKLIHLKKINIEKSEKQQVVNRLRMIYTGRPAFQDELKKAAKSAGLE